MNGEPVDIDGYCIRIGYSGPRAPKLAVLRAIVAGHTAAIPFENLDVLARRPIRLDPPSLYDKLVRHRRGSYCYEHNMLLLSVLDALGFRAAGLTARVHRNRPAGVLPPRSHMLLHVDLDEGRYIADVGFGTAVTAPLALETWREQTTPHEPFRLVPADDELDLQVRFGGAWTDLYRLSLSEQVPVDYEAMNWYTSTHPESLFVRNLIATRPATQCRHTLFNDKFTIRHCDGKAERRTVRGAAEFEEVLDRYFCITLPNPAEFGMVAELAQERAAHPDFFDHS